MMMARCSREHAAYRCTLAVPVTSTGLLETQAEQLESANSERKDVWMARHNTGAGMPIREISAVTRDIRSTRKP
jgi:hypothetical protein